ncbi:MAG: hypothetical protein ACPG8O_03960 [Alcanivorax nanhaiticus]
MNRSEEFENLEVEKPQFLLSAKRYGCAEKKSAQRNREEMRSGC